MSEPIRVLCVFSKLDRGGAETMCMNLYRRIDRSKVQFDFVKHGPGTGVLEEEILALGGRIYEAPRYRIYNHRRYCKWWKKHLEMHPEHQIIHGHFFTISSIYFKIAQSRGCITVAHSHSSGRLHGNLKEWIKGLFRKHIEKYADYCLACSQDAGNWLFPHRPFIVLKNAVDVQKFSYSNQKAKEVREEFSFGDSFVVGTVGRINAVKNPAEVVSIFRALYKKLPEARLLWVGDGPLRTEAGEMLSQAGLLDKVVFAGVRADVDRLMQAMDVFILPSLFEGLPVVLVEAQASGLPCLCSEVVTREDDLTGRCEFLHLGQPDMWA